MISKAIYVVKQEVVTCATEIRLCNFCITVYGMLVYV